MKRVMLYEDIKIIGTYKRTERWYDNDDYEYLVEDFETGQLLGYIDILEEEESDLGFDINLN